MSQKRLDNYLKTYRRRSLLSQTDVAFLLGGVSGENVSRHENRMRHPSLDTALAYEVIFQATSRDLFAGRLQAIEARVRLRAGKLVERLDIKGVSPSSRRRIVLAAISKSCLLDLR